MLAEALRGLPEEHEHGTVLLGHDLVQLRDIPQPLVDLVRVLKTPVHHLQGEKKKEKEEQASECVRGARDGAKGLA